MAGVWRVFVYWRQDWYCFRYYPQIFYLYFVPYDGLPGYCLPLRCFLDEYQELHFIRQTKSTPVPLKRFRSLLARIYFY